MKPEKILLSIDCGTSSIKVAAFDIAGNRKAFLKTHSPLDNIGGVLAVDFQKTAEVVIKLLTELVNSSGLSRYIVAVTLTSQRSTCAFLDNEGKFIGNGISWSDSHGGALLEELVNPDDFQKITGMMPIPYITAAKLCWLKKSDPEGFKRLALIQLLGDYVLQQLGAETGLIDTTNASATGFFDCQKFEWSDYILKKLSITSDQLPKVIPTGSIVGTINKKIAEKTMIPIGTPLITCGGDQQCSYIGCCSPEKPVTAISMGTSFVICTMTQKLVLNPKLLTLCGFKKWTIEGFQPSGGMCFNWIWKNILGNSEDLSEQFLKEISESGPGSRGVSFYPEVNSIDQGGICGITPEIKSVDIIRAIFEGIAYETRYYHELFKKNGLDQNEVVLCGGFAGIKSWPEIYCNVLNKKIIVPKELNSALLGAAIQGGITLKIFEDLDEGFRRMFHPARVISPDDKQTAIYDNLYSQFQNNMIQWNDFKKRVDNGLS